MKGRGLYIFVFDVYVVMCMDGAGRKALAAEELGGTVVILEGEMYIKILRVLMCMCDMYAWGR